MKEDNITDIELLFGKNAKRCTTKIIFLIVMVIAFSISLQAQYQIDTIYYPNSDAIKKITTKYGDSLKTNISYYESGKLFIIDTFRNGVIDGIARGYYENGNKMFEFSYVNGDSHGKGFWWFESGKIEEVSICSNDSCVSIKYDESGYKYSFRKYIGGKTYLLVHYCENGAVIDSSFFDWNPRSYSAYHCDGKIKATGTIVYEDTFVGDYTEYYPNGNVALAGQFQPYKPDIFFGSIKIGIWKTFGEDGILKQEERYDDKGELLGKTIYPDTYKVQSNKKE